MPTRHGFDKIRIGEGAGFVGICTQTLVACTTKLLNLCKWPWEEMRQKFVAHRMMVAAFLSILGKQDKILWCILIRY